jgi:hypothetical protein
MFLKVFRGIGPGVVFLIFLTASAAWANAFINPHLGTSFLYDNNPMPLYDILKGLIGDSAITGVIISFILVLLMSFLLVNFNTVTFFINERTFLPAVIYVLFVGLFPYYQVLNPVLPASVLLMLAIRRIMDAYRKNGIAYNFFDASILISIGSLFYANLIWFGLLVIIGIAILRTGNFRELILAILGFCTPVILITGIYYTLGKDITSLLSCTRYNLFSDSGMYFFSRLTITGLVIIGLCSVFSIFYLLTALGGKNIKSRKTFTLLLWTVIIALSVYFILPSASVELIYLLAIPLSYFLSNYLIFSKKKIIQEIVFTAILIITAVFQVMYIR